MSFSSDTKGEICRSALNRRCCAQAEAYGVLLYCNHYDGKAIRIVTECEDFAKRLPTLFWKAFKLDFDRKPNMDGGKFTFGITDPKKLEVIADVVGYDPMVSLSHHINFGVLEEEHCRTAFFRGVFLAGGSVTDPSKRYHL